jgi:flagellar biosynthesis protein FliR
MLDLFHISTVDFLMFTLIFFRMSSLIISMPFFGGEQIPYNIRIAFVLGFTFVMYRTIDVSSIMIPRSVVEYVLFVSKETGIGILLGFIASIAFFAVQMGGELIAIQLGLMESEAIDPLSSTSIPVMGQLFTFFVMVIFLLLNGHHALLKLFVDSFSMVPVGQIRYSQELFDFCIQAFNAIFVISMRIAMPAIVMMFTLMISLAFVARLIPQMNIFILSLPVKMAGGLIITSICLPLIAILFHDTFSRAVNDMYKMLTFM